MNYFEIYKQIENTFRHKNYFVIIGIEFYSHYETSEAKLENNLRVMMIPAIVK